MLARLGIVARGVAIRPIGSGGRHQELLQVVEFLLETELMLRCLWGVGHGSAHGTEDTVGLRLDCIKAPVGFLYLRLGVVEVVTAGKQQFIDDQRQRTAVEGKIGEGK